MDKPRRWNTKFIRNYMVLFGLVSSVFDFLTFGTLLFLFHASPEEFRTGWFIESLLTELVIALVVRTRRVFFRSRPGTLLLASTIDLDRHYPRTAVSAVQFAVWLCPFARTADATDDRADGALCRGYRVGEEVFLLSRGERTVSWHRQVVRRKGRNFTPFTVFEWDRYGPEVCLHASIDAILTTVVSVFSF